MFRSQGRQSSWNFCKSGFTLHGILARRTDTDPKSLCLRVFAAAQEYSIYTCPHRGMDENRRWSQNMHRAAMNAHKRGAAERDGFGKNGGPNWRSGVPILAVVGKYTQQCFLNSAYQTDFHHFQTSSITIPLPSSTPSTKPKSRPLKSPAPHPPHASPYPPSSAV